MFFKKKNKQSIHRTVAAKPWELAGVRCFQLPKRQLIRMAQLRVLVQASACEARTTEGRIPEVRTVEVRTTEIALAQIAAA
eukprot:COSAG02_NODE_44744_length_363_cov_0.981061_1_plen_81_part_00